MKRSRVLLTVVALAAVAVPLGGWAVTQQENIDWNKRLSACATLIDVDRQQAAECTAAAWTQAYEADRMTDFYAQLDILTRKVPMLSVECHESGHQAGRAALTSTDKAPDLLLSGGTATGVCNNGFLHGMLDKMAVMKADDETFGQVVAACATTDGFIRSACNDGIGHAAWLTGRGERYAVEVCTRFTESHDRVSCAAGIVMQMYRNNPFTGKDMYLDMEQPSEQIPGLCGRFAEYGATEDMVDACWMEGANPIIEKALIEAANLKENRDMPVNDRNERRVAAWKQGYDTCERFPGHEDGCRLRIVTSVTWTVGDDLAEKKILCKAFPAKDEDLCLTTTSR